MICLQRFGVYGGCKELKPAKVGKEDTRLEPWSNNERHSPFLSQAMLFPVIKTWIHPGVETIFNLKSSVVLNWRDEFRHVSTILPFALWDGLVCTIMAAHDWLVSIWVFTLRFTIMRWNTLPRTAWIWWWQIISQTLTHNHTQPHTPLKNVYTWDLANSQHRV